MVVCGNRETVVLGLNKKYELRLSAGSDFEFVCLLTNAVGDPIDILPDEVIFTVKDVKGGTVQIQKINVSYSHFDGANGRTLFSIDAADITQVVPPRGFSWVFEIRRILPSAKEIVHVEGVFTVAPEVGQ